jgi:hypothetical protein
MIAGVVIYMLGVLVSAGAAICLATCRFTESTSAGGAAAEGRMVRMVPGGGFDFCRPEFYP